MRLVCHDFSNRTAPALFGDLRVHFRACTFSRSARLAALDRIGRFVNVLTFSFPHTEDTALPPLIDPTTGEELDFVYTPQVKTPASSAERQKAQKFGNVETAELLTKQYPPMFHAATNVVSFIKAFQSLPNLTHLRLSCPLAGKKYLARRNVVDYALISLRIAVERAPLLRLDSISLLPIQPSGLFYLQPLMGFAMCPKSARRWAQIKNMTVHMQSLDTDPVVRRDHLRSLHSYLRNFAHSLVKFTFRWEGERGPSPLSLATEPCFNGLTAPAGPRTKPNLTLRALRFAVLNNMELENAVMDAAQVSAFICEHKRTLEEFKFEQVQLRTGDWDQALSPLSKISGSDAWKQNQKPADESMDVPLMLSPECSMSNMREELVDGIGVRTPGRPSDQAHKTSYSAGSWLSRAKTGRGPIWKAKEHLTMLKKSVFAWR